MKTEVVIITDDRHFKEYERGDNGYIDGYINGANNVPYAVVVIPIKKKIVLVPIHQLEYCSLYTNIP